MVPGGAAAVPDILSIEAYSVPHVPVGKRGGRTIFDTAVLADADLANGAVMIYVDATNGTVKLMLKAMDAGGTARSGEVAFARM